MKIYYENTAGTVINLLKKPYRCVESDVFNSTWEVEDDGYEKTVEIDVFDVKEDFAKNMEFLYKTLAYDSDNGKLGKLWVNGTYLLCNCLISEKEGWKGQIYSYVYLTFKAPELAWIHENRKEFYPVEKHETSDYGLDYEYDYAHDWCYTPSGTQVINVDNSSDCDFSMVVYGPVTSPTVYIGDHTYKVNIDLNYDEYLIIDSMGKTILCRLDDGTVINAFQKRNKAESVFEKIPSGESVVDYSGEFGFTLIVYEKRKEPLWYEADADDSERPEQEVEYEPLLDNLGREITDFYGDPILVRKK